MQFKSFQINNFRSIKDTKCYISPKITVLAGKNESGKTNILEALEILNEDSDFKEDDKPLHLETEEPITILFYFQLTKEEKKLFSKEYGTPIDGADEVIIKKSNDHEGYDISGSFIVSVKNKILKLNNNKIMSTNNLIIDVVKSFHKLETKTELTEISKELNKEDITTKINQLEQIKQQIPQIGETQRGDITTNIEDCINDLNSLKEASLKIGEVKDEIIELIPTVVLSSSFEDILPSEVPIEEIIDEETLKSKHKIVNDLIILSKLDIEGLKNEERQTRANITNKASKITSDDFGNYWRQDPIEISIRYDEPMLSFFIQDKGEEKLYKPGQRSKGLQWFTSFFLRLKAEGSKKNNLILVDEPGLYLHAKAQQDVLDLLEELSENNQIIFTTHSPYLIDPDKLNRIRLIIRDTKSKETRIENNFNKGSDIDTLTPIITAIGLDISRDITFSKKLNILMEGISDYYYIQAMIHYLSKKEDYTFPNDVGIIPCIGHTKIATLISLLIGWGLNYKILIDRKGTNRTFKKLKDDGIEDDKIIFVGNEKEDSIENLFSKKDLKKYNITDNKYSKTITSKMFFERVISEDDIHFSNETVNNFKSLLNKVKGNKN